MPSKPSRTSRATGKARERNPEEKRLAILRAAKMLFEHQGFAATSTAEIARAAGVSEGIVFHHHRTKQHLLEQIAEDWGRTLCEAVLFDVRAGDPPRTRVLVERVFAFVRERGIIYELLGITGDLGATARAREALRRPLLARLAVAIDDWHEHGYTRRLPDVRLSAALVFGLVETALLAVVHAPSPLSASLLGALLDECATVLDRALLRSTYWDHSPDEDPR